MSTKVCPLIAIKESKPMNFDIENNYNSCKKEKCEFYFYNACIAEHLFNMSVSLAIVASRL
ncbi:MAG: hypothetical protein WCO84_01060 [bacterium]